jgi:dTDP-4-amino-4,6-dideoxygalactose transaminase
MTSSCRRGRSSPPPPPSRAAARPVVADIDRRSQGLTADTVAAVLTPAVKAVIPVHLNGWPVDMTPLMDLAAARGLVVIEDCAQAHGAFHDGRAVGSFGRIGCFSFCQNKIISTGGEGGMIVTGDEGLHRRLWALREHGWDYGRSEAPDPGDGFRWLADVFGSNARITEVQAAIGLIQLGKLPAWVERRRANAVALAVQLSALPGVVVPTPDETVRPSFYKLAVLIDPAALKASWSRNRVLAELEARGVPARVGGCPDISRERAFAARGWTSGAPPPNATWVGERSAVLPVHPTLTARDLDFMADAVRAVMTVALR